VLFRSVQQGKVQYLGVKVLLFLAYGVVRARLIAYKITLIGLASYGKGNVKRSPNHINYPYFSTNYKETLKSALFIA